MTFLSRLAVRQLSKRNRRAAMALPALVLAASASGFVIVHPGDTLSGIAAAHGVNWHTVCQRNHIRDCNLIYPGQRIYLGGSSANGVSSRHYRAAAPIYSSHVTTTGMGSFQSCVIRRESGGNPQVMNSTGHYGLYQFSYSTWVAYGGSGGDFGHASVAEQNRVFWNAVSQPGGRNNWSPYDGCSL